MDDQANQTTRPSRSRQGGSGVGDHRMGRAAFPTELLRGLSQGRAVLFIGPGIADAVGAGHHERLKAALASTLRQRTPLSDAISLDEYLSTASLQEVAQVVHDQLGPETYQRTLAEHIDIRDVPPPPVMYALRSLPVKVLFTTNFDRMIERTFENPLEDVLDIEVSTPTPSNLDPVPVPGVRPVLVKLFGDPATLDSLVLTTDDYETYFRTRPALVQRLRTLLEAGPAIFVGYHVRDPEFRRLYAQVGALAARAHKRVYAIMPGLSPFEARWWSQRALVILPCQPGEGLEEVVRELQRQAQRHANPRLEADPDLNAPRGGTSPWALVPVLRAQLDHTAHSWLLGVSPDQLQSGFMPPMLIPDGDALIEREQALDRWLADPKEGPAHLASASPMSARELLEGVPRALVLGPSGAGKTTLLLHLLKVHAEKILDSGERQLVSYLPLRLLAASPGLSLMECLIEHLHRLAPSLSRDVLETEVLDLLTDGQPLLLLDGLDDIILREEASVLERLTAFVRDCPGARLVITCRTAAFDARRLPGELGLTRFELAPLPEEQQNVFIRDRLRVSPARAENLISLLRAGLVPWADRLVSNPLHLSQLCNVYLAEGRFPSSRADLYASFMHHLLRRNSPDSENAFYAYDKELILQAIALHAMRFPEEALTEELLCDQAELEMARAHIAPREDVSRRLEARDVVMEIVQNSGILVEAGPSKAYEFRHNALREYLAARRLLTLEDPTERAALNAHLTDRRWVGVWRLAAAMSADCTELLDAIGKAGHNDDLVARCLGDAQRVQPRWISTRLDEQGASRAFGNLMLRLREQLTASERLELFGEILWRDTELFARESRRTDTRALYVALSGILGMVATEGPMAHRAAEQLAGWRSELRLDVESSPYALVPVAAGLALLGAVGPPHQRFRQVEGFSIGQTPVTFDLYQRFDPSHALAGAAHAEEFVQPSLPVVGVSWYDAWVCACWFSCRLPTTAEWEKAAGWDAGRSHRQAFPWGDEWEAGRCNALVSTTQPGSTSPVDRFATRGQSPYGCYDMAGNVLEWTADRARGSVERRILKGGSWRGDAVMQRVSAEVWLRPGYHGLETGFRLCRSLTPAR